MSTHQLPPAVQEIVDRILTGRDIDAPFSKPVGNMRWMGQYEEVPYDDLNPTIPLSLKKRVPKLVFDPARLQAVRPVHETKNSAVFEVKWDGKRCALKVNHLTFEDMERAEEIKIGVSEPDEIRCPDRFACELDAYNRILQAGLWESGVVPRPYGWFVISNSKDNCWPQKYEGDAKEVAEEAEDGSKDECPLYDVSPYDSWLRDFKDDMRSPRALLLEWIDGEGLVTPQMTSAQFRTLWNTFYALHTARIIHNDIAPKNIIISAGSPVIVDFDVANILPAKEELDPKDVTEDIVFAMGSIFNKAQWRMPQVTQSGIAN